MNENNLSETKHLIRQLREMGDVTAPPALISTVLLRVGLADGYFGLDSPLGRLYVAYNNNGISAVLPAEDDTQFESAFHARFGRTAQAVDLPADLGEDVQQQLTGKLSKTLRFDLRGLSEFEQEVLHKALEIPRGEVRPYSWIAAEIGRPRAVRAVGSALGRNPIPLLIPCHRVIRSDGRVGNYVFGNDAKRILLQTEGILPEQLDAWATDGTRYYGSDTTHIFCYPTCHHAQRISTAHRVNFRSGTEALSAGYRPCKMCRPAA